MWVKYLKDDKHNGFEKNEVVFISDNKEVQKAYDKLDAIPLIGPDGPDIHSAPPEDVLELFENMDRSKEEKNKDDFIKYKDKKL